MNPFLIFFLLFHYFKDISIFLFDKLKEIGIDILGLPDNEVTQLLLYGHTHDDMMQSSKIINVAINLKIKSQRFDGPLL